MTDTPSSTSTVPGCRPPGPRPSRSRTPRPRRSSPRSRPARPRTSTRRWPRPRPPSRRWGADLQGGAGQVHPGHRRGPGRPQRGDRPDHLRRAGHADHVRQHDPGRAAGRRTSPATCRSSTSSRSRRRWATRWWCASRSAWSAPSPRGTTRCTRSSTRSAPALAAGNSWCSSRQRGHPARRLHPGRGHRLGRPARRRVQPGHRHRPGGG